MVPQCSVSFPQKIYFDSISFKFAGNDHISSVRIPHASHLTSLTLRAPVDDPKCKILRILGRKEGRKKGLWPCWRMARDWGGFRPASWSQPPLSLFRTPPFWLEIAPILTNACNFLTFSRLRAHELETSLSSSIKLYQINARNHIAN